MNRFIIKLLLCIALFTIISLPIIFKIFENIEYTKGLRSAIIKYYSDNCNAEIITIEMTVPLIQISNFMHIGGREQVWRANINSKDYFEGHYGNQIITLTDPKCVELSRAHSWEYDHEKRTFTLKGDTEVLNINDKKGISEGSLFFYIIFYSLNLVISFILIMRTIFRRLAREGNNIS
jgi:hypothetical protein